jgi:deoxyxylulose-5-phosphate synthase
MRWRKWTRPNGMHPVFFDKVTGEIYKKTFDTPQPPKYQDVFGHTIIELAEKNPNIMGITPGHAFRIFS